MVVLDCSSLKGKRNFAITTASNSTVKGFHKSTFQDSNQMNYFYLEEMTAKLFFGIKKMKRKFIMKQKVVLGPHKDFTL